MGMSDEYKESKIADTPIETPTSNDEIWILESIYFQNVLRKFIIFIT